MQYHTTEKILPYPSSSPINIVVEEFVLILTENVVNMSLLQSRMDHL